MDARPDGDWGPAVWEVRTLCPRSGLCLPYGCQQLVGRSQALRAAIQSFWACAAGKGGGNPSRVEVCQSVFCVCHPPASGLQVGAGLRQVAYVEGTGAMWLVGAVLLDGGQGWGCWPGAKHS